MTDPYANIRRALEAIQTSARGHRHKRDLAHLDFREACDPDTIRSLLTERDALRDVLDRIVSYYDRLRHDGRMPSMAYQAESDHENTMFGQARILLTKEHS